MDGGPARPQHWRRCYRIRTASESAPSYISARPRPWLFSREVAHYSLNLMLPPAAGGAARLQGGRKPPSRRGTRHGRAAGGLARNPSPIRLSTRSSDSELTRSSDSESTRSSAVTLAAKMKYTALIHLFRSRTAHTLRVHDFDEK
jgi:hypothetical protein